MIMNMTTNEVLGKQTFITKVSFKEGNNELSKELKVKIMAMRIEYSKVRKHFDEDCQEFVKQITPEEFTVLQAKPDRTEEENTKLNEMVNKLNSDYNAYVSTRSQYEENINNSNLTLDEYNEIVEVNAGVDVEINGQTLKSADFLEILYSLFVED